MKSIILCEGFDDVFIIGYYLFKTQSCRYDKSGKVSELYSFPKVNFRNQVIEVYKKEENSLAIWCVGGKDSFDKPFKFIKNINDKHPEDGIQKVFILTDRDNDEISTCLSTIEEKMSDFNSNIKNLVNNQSNCFQFEVEEELYNLEVIPMVIPFEEVGALETILLGAIEETSDEDKFIVSEAKAYIESLVNSGKLNEYLQHEREIIKSKFSAAISVTNPDRSIALFNTLLMSCPWEEKEIIKKHFKILNELL